LVSTYNKVQKKYSDSQKENVSALLERENMEYSLNGIRNGKGGFQTPADTGRRYQRKCLIDFGMLSYKNRDPNFLFLFRFSIKMCFLPVVHSMSMKLTHQQFPTNRPK
jgi:hypothetical protein